MNKGEMMERERPCKYCETPRYKGESCCSELEKDEEIKELKKKIRELKSNIREFKTENKILKSNNKILTTEKNDLLESLVMVKNALYK